MWFKSCEKCGGDCLIEDDGRSRDLVCLQCGFRPRAIPAFASVAVDTRSRRATMRHRLS
jgi:transcription initiation factor TFIIIB Brf1 subunit/transcription initiation factor TFIIB